MPTSDYIATNVRRKREAAGLSAAEVGRLMGYEGQAARDFVSRIERGARVPSLRLLEDLAEILDTRVDLLMRPPRL